jgi:Tol biopolymer transport system component
LRRVLLVLVGSLLAVGPASAGTTATAAAPLRILYTSDWSGTVQLYEVDPKTGRHGQLTFDRAASCTWTGPCGYVDPRPSPDGRLVLFAERALQGPYTGALYVARADGRGRKRIAQAAKNATWSPDSRRIAYVATDGVHIVNADGTADRLLAGGNELSGKPAWSPDGRWLAFVLYTAPTMQLVTVGSGAEHVLATDATSIDFAWSPSSRWIAFDTRPYSDGTLGVVHPDGTGARSILSSANGIVFSWSTREDRLAYSSSANEVDVEAADGSGHRQLLDSWASTLGWSSDGRSLAVCCLGGLRVADVVSGSVRTVAPNLGAAFFAWSPSGNYLAFAASDGLRVASGSSVRVVSPDQTSTFAWAPDARSLAYGAADGLKIADLAGKVRMLVAGGGAQGGFIRTFLWTRPPGGTRYAKPEARTLATVSSDALTAAWPIDGLAADGGRVAYVSCGHVFAWTPANRKVVQAEPIASLSPECRSPGYYTSYVVYDLAVAGDRVAFGAVQGGNVRSWALYDVELGARPTTFRLAGGYATNGGPYIPGPLEGELAGSGDLLVFGSWKEAWSPGTNQIVTTDESVERVDPGGCPCTSIGSWVALAPLDVDAGRVLLAAPSELRIVDRAGTQLFMNAESPSAAQLSGSDLVLLTRGQLRVYDLAAGGVSTQTWPLPDVPSGRECATPNAIRCSRDPELVLEDVSHGLATYVVDGQVHVLRLADGVDVTVAAGTRSRFFDAGLVYADGATLHVVPYDRLPR